MACSIPSASLECFTRYRGRIHFSPHMHTHTYTPYMHIYTHTLHVRTHIGTYMAYIYTHIYTHVHTLQTVASYTCVHVFNSKMVFTFSSSTMVTISLLTYLLNTVHVTRQAFYNTQPQHTHTHNKKDLNHRTGSKYRTVSAGTLPLSVQFQSHPCMLKHRQTLHSRPPVITGCDITMTSFKKGN